MEGSIEEILDKTLAGGYTEISLRGCHLDFHTTKKIATISNLIRIDLADAAIEDLSFLERLSKLKYVNLSDAYVRRLDRIESLSFALHLPELETLICDRTHVRSLEPLRQAEKLRTLSVRHTHVSDLTPLADLGSLHNLALDYSLVIDFLPVARLGKLVNSPGNNGLTFSNCLLARADKQIQNISSVEDNKSRAFQLFEYLHDASSTSGKTLNDTLSELLLELPRSFSAPIKASISPDGRQVVTARDVAAVSYSSDTLAEQGWSALKEQLDEIRPVLEKENFPALKNALQSFERSLGNSFQDVKPIILGTHGTRIIELAKNSKHILLEEEHAELTAFANSVVSFLGRFPEWREYKDQTFAESEKSSGLDVVRHKQDLEKLANAFEDTQIISEELHKRFEELLGLIEDEPEQNSPVVSYGILGSLANLFLSIAKGTLQVLLQVAKKTKDLAVQSVAAAIVGGAAATSATFLDFMLFNGNIISKLIKDFPSVFGWLEKIVRLIS